VLKYRPLITFQQVYFDSSRDSVKTGGIPQLEQYDQYEKTM